MTQQILPDDLFSILRKYEEKVARLERTVSGAGVAPGDIKTTSLKHTSGPPPGWLKCNGQPLPATDPSLAALRAALLADGSPYGTSGADPKVPNFNDRMPIGAGGSRSVGASGGLERVKLTGAESGVPAHNHGGATQGMNGATSHTHTTAGNGLTLGSGTAYASAANLTVGGGAYGGTSSPVNPTDINHTHNIPQQTATDASVDHENMPPWLAVTYLIKL